MRNFLMMALAFVLVLIVWKILAGLIAGLIGTLFTIGMIILFAYLVYAVFKMLTRERI